MDKKVGENYFGYLSEQLRSKGGSAFQAISNRLVLKTSSDLAFGNEGRGSQHVEGQGAQGQTERSTSI